MKHPSNWTLKDSLKIDLEMRTHFQEKVNSLEDENLRLKNRVELSTLQVNLGKLCNQACSHCHVEAGPNRIENMESSTVDRIIELLEKNISIKTLDLTGGAPELNPNFRRLVEHASSKGISVIDRCNLTVLFEPKQEDLAEFLQRNTVSVVASLPCYSEENVDSQRGGGVFEKSIKGLKLLNELGYGKKDSNMNLTLVYNPLGAFLPPDQTGLEENYKKELWERHGIEFTNLLTITNMPIKRFLEHLKRENQLKDYMDLLSESFNPLSVESIMCRSLISIGWDGKIYDCDFNQMLEMPAGASLRTIWDIEKLEDLVGEEIYFENHCFGCTAGAGSSCSGALTR